MAHPQQRRPPPRGPPPGRGGGGPGGSRRPPPPREDRHRHQGPPPQRGYYDQGGADYYGYDNYGYDDYQYDPRAGYDNYQQYNGYDDGYGGYDMPAARPPPLRQGASKPNQWPLGPADDNSFQPHNGERDISHGMGAMDLNSGPRQPAERRPHTSNSNRPPPVRQNTAPPPLSSKTPPPEAGRRTADPYRGQQHAGPPMDGPAMPPPKRSATMPVSGDPVAPPASGRSQYPGQSTYQGPNHADMSPTHNRNDDPTSDLLDDYFTSEPDMPNFDAMPGAGGSGAPDEQLIPGQSAKDKSGSKGAYAAYRPPGGSANDSPVDPGPPGRRGPPPGDFPNYPGEYDRGGRPEGGRGMPPPGRGPRGGPRGRGRGGPPPRPPPGGPGPMYGEDGRGPPPGPNKGPPNSWDQQQRGGTPAPGGADPSSNPDALPQHPAPYRPGLAQGSDRPSPVRHYDNQGPAPQQQMPQPPQPQAPPQSDGFGPQDSGVITHEELNRVQQVAHDRPNDNAAQLTLAKKLVEASIHLIDDNGRADTRMKNKNREKYVLDAHKIVKKLVAAGYGDAMFYLADCYGQGLLGLEPDQKEAYGLYQSAAKLGHAEAAYRLAVCCEMGYDGGGGTRRDPLKAVQWYRRAAALGDTPAMYKMGIILLKGLLGQQKNPREALSWLKRAAERADEDNPHALHELALLYQNPQGNDAVIRDETYSLELFTQASNFGYKFSQFRLGVAYEYGYLGCPVDPRQSIFWYTRAAAQGEHQSELALSGWYLTGAEGILQQSDTEAYLWARKAATAGLAKAEYAMGYFSEVGIGAPASMDDAKRWYWKASSQNFLKARERLEELRRGGAKMQKTRLSRSAVKKENENDCVVM